MQIILALLSIMPFDRDSYLMLDYLENKGYFALEMFKPYSQHKLIQILKRVSEQKLTKKDSFYVQFLLNRLKTDKPFFSHSSFQTKVESPFKAIGSFSLNHEGRLNWVEYYLSHKVSIFEGYDTTEFDAHPWRKRVVAEIPDARIDIRLGNIASFFFGRAQLYSGPCWIDGLLLSTNPWGRMHFGYCVNVGERTKFFYLLILADKNKYLSLHKIEFVFKNLRLGLSEDIIFFNHFNLEYLNPLSFYYFTQWNTGSDDNILWNVEFAYFKNKKKIYGELLIDDFAYQPATGPHKLGGTIGGWIIDFPRKEWEVRVEYTAIQKWVYTHHEKGNTYTMRVKPLGHYIGPDGDLLNFEISIPFLSPWNSLKFRPFYRRKGEGSIWRDFKEDKDGFHPPFPSGVVEKRKGGIVYLSFYPFLNYILNPGIEVEWIENKENEKGKKDFKFSLWLRIEARL